MKKSTTSCPSSASSYARTKGFSLIELMVVIAIIAILGLIAIPQYQKYTAKAKLAAALAELTGGKQAAEAWISEHGNLHYVDLAALGLAESSRSCRVIEAWPSSLGHFELTCVLRHDPLYASGSDFRRLTLFRDADERTWSCRTDVTANDLLPPACQS